MPYRLDSGAVHVQFPFGYPLLDAQAATTEGATTELLLHALRSGAVLRQWGATGYFL